MFSKVLSAAVYGVQSKVVQVETDITERTSFFFYGRISFHSGKRSTGTCTYSFEKLRYTTCSLKRLPSIYLQPICINQEPDLICPLP